MKDLLRIFSACCLLLLFIGCADGHKRISEKEVVAAPAEIDVKTPEIIEYSLKDAIGDSGKLLSYQLRDPEVVQYIYQAADFAPLWTKEGHWLPAADSLHTLIHESRRYGLLPEQYYEARLDSLKQLTTSDTASKENKLDAALWAQTELLFTGALVRMIKDLKLGRLMHDSIANKNGTLTAQFYLAQIERFKASPKDSFAVGLEPSFRQYTELKNALQVFLAKANLKKYSYVNLKDSLRLPVNVARRLKEDSLYNGNPAQYDSLLLSESIKRWQQKKKLKEDGRLNAALVYSLNNNDYEKFLRIAINMDRLKGLPPLPQQYIWVNIPAYRLQLFDADTVVLTSRVVVGKPQTATPQLTSALSDMITYPKWYIPQSIIKKRNPACIKNRCRLPGPQRVQPV